MITAGILGLSDEEDVKVACTTEAINGTRIRRKSRPNERFKIEEIFYRELSMVRGESPSACG
jgi:hypothetical protein